MKTWKQLMLAALIASITGIIMTGCDNGAKAEDEVPKWPGYLIYAGGKGKLHTMFIGDIWEINYGESPDGLHFGYQEVVSLYFAQDENSGRFHTRGPSSNFPINGYNLLTISTDASGGSFSLVHTGSSYFSSQYQDSSAEKNVTIKFSITGTGTDMVLTVEKDNDHFVKKEVARFNRPDGRTWKNIRQEPVSPVTAALEGWEGPIATAEKITNAAKSVAEKVSNMVINVDRYVDSNITEDMPSIEFLNSITRFSRWAFLIGHR